LAYCIAVCNQMWLWWLLLRNLLLLGASCDCTHGSVLLELNSSGASCFVVFFVYSKLFYFTICKWTCFGVFRWWIVLCLNASEKIERFLYEFVEFKLSFRKLSTHTSTLSETFRSVKALYLDYFTPNNEMKVAIVFINT
jgi:hypothetical protein